MYGRGVYADFGLSDLPRDINSEQSSIYYTIYISIYIDVVYHTVLLLYLIS
jgi:hypothetical protein